MSSETPASGVSEIPATAQHRISGRCPLASHHGQLRDTQACEGKTILCGEQVREAQLEMVAAGLSHEGPRFHGTTSPTDNENPRNPRFPVAEIQKVQKSSATVVHE